MPTVRKGRSPRPPVEEDYFQPYDSEDLEPYTTVLGPNPFRSGERAYLHWEDAERLACRDLDNLIIKFNLMPWKSRRDRWDRVVVHRCGLFNIYAQRRILRFTPPDAIADELTRTRKRILADLKKSMKEQGISTKSRLLAEVRDALRDGQKHWMEQARTAASRPDETRPQPAVRDPVDRREATIARKQREQGFGGHGGRGKLATHLGVSPDTLRGLINQNRRKCSAKTEAKLRTKIPITADDDWPDVV